MENHNEGHVFQSQAHLGMLITHPLRTHIFSLEGHLQKIHPYTYCKSVKMEDQSAIGLHEIK